MKKQEHSWHVELLEIYRSWISQVWVFFLTGLTFIGIALPVLISGFILWYLAGFPPLLLPF